MQSTNQSDLRCKASWIEPEQKEVPVETSRVKRKLRERQRKVGHLRPVRVQLALKFGFWGREFASDDCIGKSGSFVGAVAKRLVLGMATAAKRDGSAPSEPERLALRVDNFEVAFDADRSVGVNSDFGCRHVSPARREYAPNHGLLTSDGACHLAAIFCRSNTWERRRRLRRSRRGCHPLSSGLFGSRPCARNPRLQRSVCRCGNAR